MVSSLFTPLRPRSLPLLGPKRRPKPRFHDETPPGDMQDRFACTRGFCLRSRHLSPAILRQLNPLARPTSETNQLSNRRTATLAASLCAESHENQRPEGIGPSPPGVRVPHNGAASWHLPDGPSEPPVPPLVLPQDGSLLKSLRAAPLKVFTHGLRTSWASHVALDVKHGDEKHSETMEHVFQLRHPSTSIISI